MTQEKMTQDKEGAFVDYYQVLQIDVKASPDDIRKAYIKQSLVWHPDRNPDPLAKGKFQEIANAYFVLSDPDRRRAYDIDHKAGRQTVDPTAIFTSVFDDLLIPEVENPIYFWQPIGALAGILIGFIIFNIPGAIFGYYFGSKTGKVRDMKGVSVYEAFSKLPLDKRGQILSDIGKKMFKTAITS